MMRFTLTMRQSLLFLLILSSARADWPTYLHDNSRVGHTEEALKASLAARWKECPGI
jgi:hypothetical protein